MLLLAVFFIWCDMSVGAVSVTASATRIPRGQPTMVSITYSFTAVPGTSTTSTQGSFRVSTAAGPVTIAIVNRPMTVGITSGRGIATESVDISLNTMEQVMARGTTRFYYERSFPGASGTFDNSAVARINFQIVSDSMTDLSIRKVDLYFENMRPEVTVERGHKGLKAFADISYAGSGLFEGYWEVDGRVISRVFQQLTFGGLLKLQTPDIPELPTFDPGTHRIRFVITRPAQGLPIPVIIYFVNLDRFKPAIAAIGVVSPQDDTLIEYGLQRFEWQRPANAVVFLVQFGDKLESKTTFSAYTRDAFYVIPGNILRANFKVGERYYWKVIGFDDENAVVGESAVRSFIFKKE